jgi:type IV fimbrial biogenesis protein FimT
VASIRCKRRGFTLIELMVTLAVFTILCLLAMPSFNTWIANNRVRAVAEDVSNGLLLARTEALRRSRQSVFALTNQANPAGAVNAGAPAYSAVNGSANNWAVSIAPSLIDSNAGVFVRGGALADINASVTINGPAAACFDPLGNLITNASAVANTGVGASCSAPSGGQPALIYSVKSASAAGDHPLQIEVGLGGQVRLCNPAQSLSSGTPGASEGCQYPQGATP